jgi:hypothetical protein
MAERLLIESAGELDSLPGDFCLAMMNKRHTPQFTSAAIAAVLMFTPAAGLAQAALAPEIAVPDISAQPAPEPQPPAMTSSPVVQPVAEPEPAVEQASEPAPPPAARTVARQSAPPRAVVAAPAAAPLEPNDAIAEPVEAVTSPDVEPVATAPVAAVDEPMEPAADNSRNIFMLLAVLGTLAVLALTIWGFVAIGRRKPIEVLAAEIERPLPKNPEPAALASVEPVVPEASVPAPVVRNPVTPIGSRTVSEPGLPHAGAAIALPRKMPESFQEREALIERMVAAGPDRANPFTTPVKRRKRAKLILQSLGRDFGDEEPRIDLSQYPHNWPELARRKHAAA